MERINRPLTIGLEQGVRALAGLLLRLAKRAVRGIDLRQLGLREVVGHRRGQDEVAVREALHEGARAQTIGPLVGEVRLAADEEPRDRRHQVVVDPESAHRVVRRGVDAHRHLVGVVPGDPLVDLEEVSVLLADVVLAQPVDRASEIEIDAVPTRPYATPLVAYLLGGA